MNDQVKNTLKSKLKTQLDSVINDILGEAKLALNRTVDTFLDQLWPGLVAEFVRQYDAELKAKEDKRKKEQAEAAKLSEAKQNIEPSVVTGQDSTPVATN